MRLWKFFRWVQKGIYRARRRVSGPGPASGLVLLGDPPSFDEDDANPHCCVKPQKMQLPCRRLRRPRRVLRHGPVASCSASMASRVSVSGTPGDASPGPATTSVATTVPASIKDSARSRRAPRAFRRSREAAVCRVLDVPANRPCGRLAHPSIRPCPPEMRRHGASVPTGCISPCESAILGIAGRVAPRRRQPQATAVAPVPDSRRLSGPPRSGRNGSRPTTIRRSLGGAEYTPWHQGGTRKKVLAAPALLAAMPI